MLKFSEICNSQLFIFSVKSGVVFLHFLEIDLRKMHYLTIECTLSPIYAL